MAEVDRRGGKKFSGYPAIAEVFVCEAVGAGAEVAAWQGESIFLSIYGLERGM